MRISRFMLGIVFITANANAQPIDASVPAYRQALPMAAYKACSGRQEDESCSYSDITVGIVRGQCQSQTLRPLPSNAQDRVPQQARNNSVLGPSMVCMAVEQMPQQPGNITTIPAQEPSLHSETSVSSDSSR